MWATLECAPFNVENVVAMVRYLQAIILLLIPHRVSYWARGALRGKTTREEWMK